MPRKTEPLELIILNTGLFGGGIAGVKIAQYAEWLVLNENHNESVLIDLSNIFKSAPYFCVGSLVGIGITIGSYVLIKNYNYKIEDN